jgi:phage protein D
MPLGSARIVVLLADADAGDASYYGTWTDLSTYLVERLITFKFADDEKKKDVLTLTLRNEDFALIDQPVFAKGQHLLVCWGWPSEMKPPRRMQVVKVAGGNPLVVTCHCMLSRMDKDKQGRFMENVSDSDWVREVAAEYGYKGTFLHLDDTTVKRDVTQAGWQTDARMIAQLARRNHFQFYVDATGLHFHPRRTDGGAVVDYIYRTDPGMGSILEEPRVEVDLTLPTAKVRVAFRDPRTKVVGEVAGGPQDTSFTSLGRVDEVGDPDDPNAGRRGARLARVDLRSAGLVTEQDAKALADARYRQTIASRYKMTLVTLGRGIVGAKMLVGVYGVSEQSDGLYYVAHCDDEIEGGKFQQTLSLEKDAYRKIKAANSTKRQSPNANADKPAPEYLALKSRPITIVGPEGTLIPATQFYLPQSGTSGQEVNVVPLEGAALTDLPEKYIEQLVQQGAQTAEWNGESVMPEEWG